MIPEGWKEGRLLHLISRLDAGVSVNSEDRAAEKDEKAILKTSCVSGWIFDPNKHKAIVDEVELARASEPVEGDRIILSRMNTPALVGASAYISRSFPDLFLPDRLWQLKPKNNSVSMRWVSYFLALPHTRFVISNMATGTSGTMKNITKKDVLSIKLLIPTYIEQQKIAQILSTWDKAIETVEALIEKSTLQKKALMQQLLTGEIKLSGYADEKWQTVLTAKMGKIISGGTPDTTNSEYWDGDVLWTTPTDITALTTRFINNTKRKITEKGVEDSSATLLPKGSLLVCTRATIGYMAIAKSEITTNQGFKSLVPNSGFDVGFIYYLFSYFKHFFVRMASGSTFLEISKKDFSKLAFSVPGLKNQQAIAAILSDIDSVISNYKNHLSCLRQEKQAIMQQLLTGKRRVRLDETDKPVSLLESTA